MAVGPEHDVRRVELIDCREEGLGGRAHDDEWVHVDARGAGEGVGEFANLPMFNSEFASTSRPGEGASVFLVVARKRWLPGGDMDEVQ